MNFEFLVGFSKLACKRGLLVKEWSSEPNWKCLKQHDVVGNKLLAPSDLKQSLQYWPHLGQSDSFCKPLPILIQLDMPDAIWD